MAEPITVLSGTLATVVATVLQQFGVPMRLVRKTIIPSASNDPTIRDDVFTCRGVGGEVVRKYDKQTGTMRRESELVLSDPGVEPRAGDVITLASGAVVLVITEAAGITKVAPDLQTVIAYQVTIRVA